MKIKKYFLTIVLLLFFILFLPISYTNVFATSIDEDLVTVPAAIMVETTSNNILYERNAYQQMYPASTTKILTAIIAIENCNLSDNVTIKYNTIMSIPIGYSTAYLDVDEVLTVEQLLNLTLIESANDAANALAEYVAGSEESFASLMNTKAHEIGCVASNFTNAYGRHDDNHYTTAHDLYLIAEYAMKNPTFRNIVRKRSYVTYPTNKYDSERLSTNTNLFLNPNSSFYDKRAIGIKTGFTTPAGNCLVSCFNDKDMELIVVVLGGEQGYNQYKSTTNLINYAFKEYSYKTIYETNDYYSTVEVENATTDTKDLKILTQNEIKVFGNTESLNKTLVPTVELSELEAPIKAGDVIGSISYNVFGTTYSANLIAATNVQKSILPIIIGILCAIIFTLLFILKFKFSPIFNKNKKRKKSYNKYYQY